MKGEAFPAGAAQRKATSGLEWAKGEGISIGLAHCTALTVCETGGAFSHSARTARAQRQLLR